MTDTNQLPPSEREAFEAFAQNCPMGKYSIARRGDGYDSSHTQLMWDAWQARAQVQGEPVVSRNPFASRCYTMSESHLSGYRLIVGFEKLEDAQDAHEWVARQVRGDFTHSAPSAPADVMRDAIATVREQYRGTDWGKAAECICDAIDAAMLAAKDTK